MMPFYSHRYLSVFFATPACPSVVRECVERVLVGERATVSLAAERVGAFQSFRGLGDADERGRTFGG